MDGRHLGALPRRVMCRVGWIMGDRETIVVARTSWSRKVTRISLVVVFLDIVVTQPITAQSNGHASAGCSHNHNHAFVLSLHTLPSLTLCCFIASLQWVHT